MTDEIGEKSRLDAVKNWISNLISSFISWVVALGYLALIPAALFVAIAWHAQGTTNHLICKGTAVDIFADTKRVHPYSQLGIELTNTNWLGRKVFEYEPRYQYALIAIDEVNGGTPIRQAGVNLTFTELSDDVIMGDERDDLLGRTMLYLDSRSGYVGLSNRKENNGFDFDGYCEPSHKERWLSF